MDGQPSLSNVTVSSGLGVTRRRSQDLSRADRLSRAARLWLFREGMIALAERLTRKQHPLNGG